MKRVLILLSLICFSSCSMINCDSFTDQEKCNEINVEQDGLFCFKANITSEYLQDDYEYEYEGNGDYEGYEDGEEKTKCMTFPIEAENQKLFFQVYNGFLKETFSMYGKTFGSYEEEEDYENIESQLLKSRKDFYNTNEMIQIDPGTLSSTDKDKLISEQTCAYYFYGRFYKKYIQEQNTQYENINNENMCYNAIKFNEFKNIIDCGYAEIKGKFNGNDFNIKTCYLIPTANVPDMFKEVYTSYQNEVWNNFMLHDIVCLHTGGGSACFPDDGDSGDSGEYEEDYNESGRRRRRLTDEFSYEIEVKNKYGRIVSFSNTDNSYTIKEQGVPGPQETLDENPSSNKSSFMRINAIVYSFLILLFSL